MKTFLFDFLTFQDSIINGGYLYTRTILLELLKKDYKIVGICENEKLLSKEIQEIVAKNNIKVYSGFRNIEDIIKVEKIDKFFIGIAQRYNHIDLNGIACDIYIVCHDVGDICMANAKLENDLDLFKTMKKLDGKKFGLLNIAKKELSRIKNTRKFFNFRASKKYLVNGLGYQNFSQLIKQENVHIITVSEYSKYAIKYYFDDIANEILVFYCPKVYREKKEVSPSIGEKINGRKFFLLLSVNRYNKNVDVFLKQFQKFNKENDDQYFAVLVGTNYSNKDENIIGFKYLNDSELEYLMQKAYILVYPSLCEGFGLPPIESMEYGVPVLCAYDTSIPEICGEAAMYFNPLYQEDLFYKAHLLINNYEEYSKRAVLRAKQIYDKQNSDLAKLIEILTC